MYWNLIRVKEYIPTSNCTEVFNCTYMTTSVEKDTVDDASAGMAIVLLLFIIPKKFSREGCKVGKKTRKTKIIVSYKITAGKKPGICSVQTYNNGDSTYASFNVTNQVTVTK